MPFDLYVLINKDYLEHIKVKICNVKEITFVCDNKQMIISYG